MARRKNPFGTFFLFLLVVGFAGAAYQFLYVERILDASEGDSQPKVDIPTLKLACIEGLSSDECFDTITNFTWRGQSSRYRVDVMMRDGCGVPEAKKIAARLTDLVKRATNYDAEVACYILNRQVYHFVP